MSIQIPNSEGKNIKTLLASLNNRLQTIDTSLKKLKNVPSSIKTLEALPANFEKFRTETLEKIGGIKTTADLALSKFKEHDTAIQKLRDDMNLMKYNYIQVNDENRRLKKQVNGLENYGRRSNLVIRGIPESEGENCEQLARQFMSKNLKIEANFCDNVEFVRIHRLGKRLNPQQRWPRPIIMRFYNFGHRQRVWQTRATLRNTKYSLCENFSSDTDFNRNKLYPIYQAAKRMPQYERKVSMVEDVLVVDSKRYTIDTISKLPDELHPKKFTSKTNEESTVYVFGGTLSEYNSFSNWSPARIEHGGFVYSNLEQAYMYKKATHHQDVDAAQKIRYTTDPREVKRIGSSIQVPHDGTWHEVKSGVMLNLVRAKFTQNIELKRELLATGTMKLGETGKDSFFSIGLALTNRQVLDPNMWTAPSELGKALEMVREELRAG